MVGLVRDGAGGFEPGSHSSRQGETAGPRGDSEFREESLGLNQDRAPHWRVSLVAPRIKATDYQGKARSRAKHQPPTDVFYVPVDFLELTRRRTGIDDQ
jgi:hypothetical protein